MQKHTNNTSKEKEEEEEEEETSFIRACGLTVCPKCHKQYYSHKKHKNHNWLRVLCSRELVKL